MKLYRVSYRTDANGHGGYSFHGSKVAATAAVKAWVDNDPGDRDPVEHDATVEPIEVKPTKTGILAALNRYAVHNDNG